MKRFFIIGLLLFFTCSSTVYPQKVPTGKWSYKIFLNGLEVGNAFISNDISDGKYVSVTEYKMKLQGMDAYLKDSATETLDFKPIKTESYTKFNDGKKNHESKMTSTFKGNEVTTTMDKNKTTFKIEKDFILEGSNYFLAKLIESKFKKDNEITAYVFNPAVELNKPILVKTKNVGKEDVEIYGKNISLVHLTQSIENINNNVDLFIDKDGIVIKGIISLLNMKIELIKD